MSSQSSSKKTRGRIVPVALASCALAAALALRALVQVSAGEPERPQPTSPPAPVTRGQESRDGADPDRLRELERRVAELASRQSPAPVAQPAPAPAPAAAPPPMLDPKEQAQQVHEDFELLVDRSMSEPRDAAWASRFTRTLESKLEELRGSSHYQILKVDCRTHVCVAELGFSSFADARANLGQLVVNTQDQGCGRTGHIDPTDDPSQPSKARILFQCDRPDEGR